MHNYVLLIIYKTTNYNLDLGTKTTIKSPKSISGGFNGTV